MSEAVLAASILIFMGLAAGDGWRLELRSVYGAADPLALAVAPDESRLFVAEGTDVVELDLARLPFDARSELSRTAVDAAVVGMACTAERLWIAGGSQGLWCMEIAGDERQVRCVDDRGESVCLAVAATPQRILATFGSHAGAELCAYDATSLALERVVPLPAGTPFALAAHGSQVFVALGAGGLCCVELEGEGPACIASGPDLSQLAVPDGFGLERGLARDLALDGDSLLVAADSAGLVEIELAGGLRPESKLHVVPLPKDGGPFYAVRVAARDGSAALALSRGPARALDGAPWSSFGALGWDLAPGAIDLAAAPAGRADLALVFRRAKEGWTVEHRAELDVSAWRSIALGRERLYEQHMRIGLLVRDREAEGMPVIATRRARGVPAIDGVTSLLDPDLVLFGMDSQGALARGLVRIGEGERLTAVEGTQELRSLGLTCGAQWIDAERGCEWIVGDHGLGWALHRLEPGSPPRIASWPIVRPVDPDGRRGTGYFRSSRAGDRLLLTCAGTRFGLALYSARELALAASSRASGTELDLPPQHLIETHEVGERPPCTTWSASTFASEEGRTFAAVPAGTFGGEREGVERPARLLVFDLGAEDAPPRPVAAIHGRSPHGQAIAAATVVLGGRRFVLVADVGGRLCVFDATRPEATHLIEEWSAPPCAFDGRPDVLLDIAVLPQSSATCALALLAAGRRGIVQLELSSEPFAIRDLGAIDTPGWAAGLDVMEREGRLRLLVGDQKGGLRLYEGVGWKSDAPSLGR